MKTADMIVPTDWEKRTIKELGNGLLNTVQTGPFGAQLHAEDYVEDGVPLLLIRNLRDGRLDPTAMPKVSNKDAGRLSRYSLKLGDVVFSRVGRVGSCFLAKSDHSGWLISGQLLRVRIGENSIDQGYLYRALTSQYAQDHIRGESVGTTRTSINTNILESLLLLVPTSKREQTKIAEILSTLDRAIEQTESLIAKQQRIKIGLMQDLLTRGIDEHGNLRSEQTHQFKASPLGRIPVEWEVMLLGASAIDLVDGDRGGNYPKQDELLEDGYCLFLSAKNVTRSGFRFSERQFITADKDRKLGSGKLVRCDIILTTRGTVGNFAFYDNSVPHENIRINSGMIILRNRDARLLPEFIFESLRNYIYECEFKRIVSGSAQPQLPARDLKAFHIIRPSVEEQQIIISRIVRLNNIAANQERHLVKLRALKTALMQDLLTGKKRVTPLPDPELAH